MKFAKPEVDVADTASAKWFGKLKKLKQKRKALDSVRLKLASLSNKHTRSNAEAPVIVVTSQMEGDGVSTISVGMAMSFVRAVPDQRVLIVDASLRQPRIFERLPLTSTRPVSHASNFPEIMSCDTENIDVLPLDTNNISLLEKEVFDGIMPELRSKYSGIVVDAGSIESHAPYLCRPWADYVLLIVDCTKTNTKKLDRLRKELADVDFKIDGVILNKRRFAIPNWIYKSL